MLGSSHLADTFPVYELGGIAVLRKTSSVWAFNVINILSVRSVPFILYTRLTRVSPWSIFRSDPSQLKEPRGFARVSISTRVHFQLKLVVVQRWQRHGPLCGCLYRALLTYVRRIAVFNVSRINCMVRTTRRHYNLQPTLHGQLRIIGIACEHLWVAGAFKRVI